MPSSLALPPLLVHVLLTGNGLYGTIPTSYNLFISLEVFAADYW